MIGMPVANVLLLLTETFHISSIKICVVEYEGTTFVLFPPLHIRVSF